MTERPHRPTAVELTAKRWKGMLVIGHIISWPAVVALLTARITESAAGTVVAAIATAMGLGLLAYAKFMAWWHHG